MPSRSCSPPCSGTQERLRRPHRLQALGAGGAGRGEDVQAGSHQWLGICRPPVAGSSREPTEARNMAWAVTPRP